jgi:hypothetical protein
MGMTSTASGFDAVYHGGFSAANSRAGFFGTDQLNAIIA